MTLGFYWPSREILLEEISACKRFHTALDTFLRLLLSSANARVETITLWFSLPCPSLPCGGAQYPLVLIGQLEIAATMSVSGDSVRGALHLDGCYNVRFRWDPQ